MKQRKEAKKAEPKSNGRLKEIIAVLKKYNYDDGFTPEIIVDILQDLGPTFVKLGQIASQQIEYMPAEYSQALAKLRSKVAPMDMDTVRAQIEKYLGKPVDELFASFDEKALRTVSRLTGYAVRALIIVALFIGSCLLCTTSAVSGNGMEAMTVVFRAMGFVGIVISLFFAQRLYRNMRKGKQ